MADSSRPTKKRKADATTDTHCETAHAVASDLDKTAAEKQMNERSQALQAAHGLSMAPYTASELAHFSHDRLVKYIVDLQEEFGKIKSERWIKAEEGTVHTGSPIKAEEELVHAPVASTKMKQESKDDGLPFFGDAGPGVDLEQEKAFRLEVIRTRAIMRREMLRSFRKENSSNAPSGFLMDVRSKRVIEELFGPVATWEGRHLGRKAKEFFIYHLDVSPRVPLGT